MNGELFESLLHEEESTSLDFKREQYKFSKSSPEDKSELLKDILGFANAWRRSEAYILIGVKEVRGGRSTVEGIRARDHLDDHSVQQFVNNLSNQPVHFHYEAFGFEGKQVGIIRIEEQLRPVYLKKDYGKLAKEKVYVRRGSSTDPAKPASPDETAQMRVRSGELKAELMVEFTEAEHDNALGKHFTCAAELCEMPAREAIPNLGRRRDPGPFGVDFGMLDPGVEHTNADFFRELASYEFAYRLHVPIRILVTNAGEVGANDVHVELTVPADIGASVLDASEMPRRPSRRWDLGANLDGIAPLHRNAPGTVDIDKNSERFRIEIPCGDLQPGRRIWSDVFFIARGETGDLSFQGLAFAANLPQPERFTLTVSITVTKTTMTVDELRSL